MHDQASHLPLDKLPIHRLQVFVQQLRKARAQVEGLLSNQMKGERLQVICSAASSAWERTGMQGALPPSR
jgi:hypothetical protein